MGYHVHAMRNLVAPAAAGGAEVKLCPPFPTNRGGDGWSGMLALADGGTAAAPSIDEAATPVWTNFESTALSTADRFNGLLLKSQGATVRITNYDETSGTFSVTPSLPANPSVGDPIKIQADFPRLVSKITFQNNEDSNPPIALRYSATSDNLATEVGVYELLPGAGPSAGMGDLPNFHRVTIVDTPMGTPSFAIWILSDGVVFPTADDFSFSVFTP